MSVQQILCGPDIPDRFISLMGVSMKPIVPYPVSADATDDNLNVLLSDGSVLDKGRLSGYPGTQMSELAVDEYGTAYWVDPLDNRTDIADLYVRLNVGYSSSESGVFQGAGELSEFYSTVLTRNDFTPEDKGLVHIIPAVPTQVQYRSATDITFDYGIRVTATSIYNTSYAMSKFLDRTISGTSDGFLWVNSAPNDSNVTIEYPEPIMVTGFIYRSFRGDYPLRNGRMEVSMDGVNYTVVSSVAISTLTPQAITPVVAKYVRVVSGTGGKIGIGQFNVLTSKLEAQLAFNVDTQWYDPETIRVVETDTTFEMSEVLNTPPNTDNFTAVTLADRAELVARLGPDESVSLTSMVPNAIRFNEAIHNGLGAKVTGPYFTVPEGHYIFDFSLIAGNFHYGPLSRVFVQLMDLDSRIPMSTPLLSMRRSFQPIDFLVEGRFELFVPTGTRLALMEHRNATTAVTIDSDTRCRLRITKVSDTPMGETINTSRAYTHKNLLADYEVGDLVLDSSGLFEGYQLIDGFNESALNQKFALLTGAEPTVDNPWWISFKLPEPKTPTHLTMTSRPSPRSAGDQHLHPWNNFSVFAKIDGEWVKVANRTVVKPISWATSEDIALELTGPSDEYRIEFYDKAAAYIVVNTIRLHDDTALRGKRISAEIPHHTTTSSVSSDRLLTDREPDQLITLSPTNVVTFRGDTAFNLHITYSMVNTYSGNVVSLHRVVNGVLVHVRDVSINWSPSIQPDIFESGLQPGLYQLSAATTTVISNIYLEAITP